MSSMISIFIGMGIFVGSILVVCFLNKYLNLDLLLILHIIFIAIISVILYIILMKVGVKEYRRINV